jgi:hypothetical protein
LSVVLSWLAKAQRSALRPASSTRRHRTIERMHRRTSERSHQGLNFSKVLQHEMPVHPAKKNEPAL